MRFQTTCTSKWNETAGATFSLIIPVSRAQYDAHIYTNDKSSLTRQLSRDASHATAMQQEMKQLEPLSQKIEPQCQPGLSKGYSISR